MVDYNKLVLNSTIYLIEGNEDIVKNEEAGFISSNNIFVNNQLNLVTFVFYEIRYPVKIFLVLNF